MSVLKMYNFSKDVCWHFLTLLYMNDLNCRTTGLSRVLLMLNALFLLIPGTTANLSNGTYFTSTGKPLQCHEVNTFHVRSPIECSLHCKENLYPCAGYVYVGNKRGFPSQCEVCFIYDLKTPLVTVNVTNGTAVGMPQIKKETGEITS